VDDVLLEVSVRAPPAAEAEFARREEDVTVRGAAEAGADGGPPGAGAEWVRPIDGGPAGCEEVASLGFDGAGLSQDEKKSSSSAVVPDCVVVLEVLTPSTKMPPGDLCGRVRSISKSQPRQR
jgi:hypothetical protein